MEEERRSEATLVIVIATSLVVHVGAWSGLGLLPARNEVNETYAVTVVDVLEERPPLQPELEPDSPPERGPEPEAEPEPERLPREPVVRRERPSQTPLEEVPRDDPPAAVDEQIEDFTGETLTNDQDLAWVSAVGNGESSDAPIGAPTGIATGRHRAGTDGSVVGDATGTTEAGVGLVAVRDLSTAPGAPGTDRLVSLIRRFYPIGLRQLEIEGRATVRLRIGPDGNVSRLRVRSESEPGFGQACLDVLAEAGAWDPRPLDREGNPVWTEVNFECRFTVRS